MANIKVIAENRRAYHEYEIIETFEVGIALTGTEVKSARQGHFALREAFVKIKDNELWLMGSSIAPYEHGNRFNHDPGRSRKLLAHRAEIYKLNAAVAQKRLSIIATKAYFCHGRMKIEIALARGKKLYDKRYDQKKRSELLKSANKLKELRAQS